MKRPIAIWLVTSFAALPAAGRAQEQCLAAYKADLAAVSAKYADLEKQAAAIVNAAKGRSLTEAERAALKSIEAQRAANPQLKAEADKRMAMCMSGRPPATEAELKKADADMKARTAEQERVWLSLAKKYENIAAGRPGAGAGAGSGDAQGIQLPTQGLVAMPLLPDTASAPPTSSPSTLPSFGSGRTRQQRAAAVAAVNAELNRLPYLLPSRANAPSRDAILKLAATRNASARKNLGPKGLAEYSRLVTWAPHFDGLSPDVKKARALSLLVSVATNYSDQPQFTIALASAVFALDPQSTAAANNLASAMVTAGERLYRGQAQTAQLASYRRDAESCFLYAMASSMKGDAWTDDSLTAIVNLGNLYLDLGRLEEARSLFQVARKQNPFSWDAALGMAAYFHAVKKPDKALAILEDDDLDRPQTLMLAARHAKALEKNDDVPIGSPEELYEDRIKSVNAVPIATAADFMSQIDQSERNKVRYFVENLPVKGSFTAPSIKKLTQYASLRAIASPQGKSALKDFVQMLQLYSLSSFAAAARGQMRQLSRMGLEVAPGVDLDDVARNPQKYLDRKNPKPKVDARQLKANLEKLRQQATAAERELATGKTASLVDMAAQLDPFFGIVQLDPHDYADPMNVIVQKQNFAVLNRKLNLYDGYLYSVNRKLLEQFNEIAANYQRKVSAAEKARDADLERLKSSKASGAELLLLMHAVHVTYFNACNSAAETAFGSAANVAAAAYVNKIKPKAEAYYYDVIRHIGLISDPEVRDEKDTELRRSIYAALVTALNTVAAAHGSFRYHPEWECGCDVAGLLRQKEAEEAAAHAEENARILRNKAAKSVFDSGEIPPSTPLWKKLDGYGFDFDYFFVSGRMSCARTLVKMKVSLPLEGVTPELSLSNEVSEFTGAAKYDDGLKLTVKGGDDVKAYVNLNAAVSTNNEGMVKDWSVTAGTGLEVKVKDTTVSVAGQITFRRDGVTDSDFSAGVKQDFKNEFGGEANVSFEASTKHGCSRSAEVAQTLEPVKKAVDDAKEAAVGKDAAEAIPTDDLLQLKRPLFAGKYAEEGKEENAH